MSYYNGDRYAMGAAELEYKTPHHVLIKLCQDGRYNKCDECGYYIHNNCGEMGERYPVLNGKTKGR